MSGVTRKQKPFIFCCLKYQEQRQDGFFLRLSVSIFEILLFTACSEKKNTLFQKNHSFRHKFDWPRKSRNNSTIFSHKISFFKMKKKYMDKKDSFINAFFCFLKLTYLSYPWIHEKLSSSFTSGLQDKLIKFLIVSIFLFAYQSRIQQKT